MVFPQYKLFSQCGTVDTGSIHKTGGLIDLLARSQTAIDSWGRRRTNELHAEQKSDLNYQLKLHFIITMSS